RRTIMSQSVGRILLHVVFSTKNREATLLPSVREDLYGYMAGVLNARGCVPIQVGGTADHIHALFGLSRVRNTAEIVRALKSHSSKWLKTKSPQLSRFSWQLGYGAFSVDQRGVRALVTYIQGQEEHHKKRSYQAEFRKILKRYEVEFD